jgi:hypothetical protein
MRKSIKPDNNTGWTVRKHSRHSGSLNAYQQLNESFDRKVIFRVGDDAGFFSEYNNMLLAMLYCLQYRYQFVLTSKYANFAFNKGWTDYFEPFVKENNVRSVLRYNHRPTEFSSRIPRPSLLRRILLRMGIEYSPTKDRSLRLVYLAKKQRLLLTQDIFADIRSMSTSQMFDFPTIGIQGNVRQACHQLLSLTWRFNGVTQNAIQELIQTLGLPAHYIGLHIRAGDKISEHQLILPKTYIEKTMHISDIHVAFVLTDDYDVMIELQNEFPQWNFYTLCNKNEHGYYHTEFMKQTQQDIKEAHIKLFASMEVLANSDFCIGTYSSNPGMYLGLRMPEGRFHGVDFEEWKIW